MITEKDAVEMLTAEFVNICSSHSTPLRDFNGILSSAKFHCCVEHITMSLVSSMDAYCIGMPEETIEVHERWPATWWEHFKERFFPAWALERWPVRYREINVSEKRYSAVCPHVHVAQNGPHFEFLYRNRSPILHNPGNLL